MARESLVAASNKEDTKSKQGYSGDDEDPNSKISSRHSFTP
jgi:hypothetical protein